MGQLHDFKDYSDTWMDRSRTLFIPFGGSTRELDKWSFEEPETPCERTGFWLYSCLVHGIHVLKLLVEVKEEKTKENGASGVAAVTYSGIL